VTLAQVPQEANKVPGAPRLEEPATVDLARLIGGWSVPVAIVDREGRVCAWNRGAALLYGRTQENVLGQEWSTLVGEDHMRDSLLSLGPDTRRYETRHRAQDGRILDVMVTRTEMLTHDGGSEGALLLVTDLTASRVMEGRLTRRIAQLSVVREIGEALQSAMDLTGILRTILVGATASQGLRFNRAFLLLVDAKRGDLRGRVAIGPSDAEEAARIWSELSRFETRLKELLRKYEPYFDRAQNRVNEIVRALSVRLEDENRFLVRVVRSMTTVRVVNGVEVGSGRRVEEDLLRSLGVASFVAVPLHAEGKPMGLLLADNAITGKSIEDEDVGILELLGIQAALAIERAQLSGELETQVASLEAATRQIRENHDRLLRAERLSAVGQMAARVAHEIRNPLVAIGGFARLLLRDAPAEGSMRENIQIIASEVRRLETILREVLDFSNPTPPRMGKVDLTRLGHEAVELLRWELREASVAIRFEADEDLPEARADRDQVFQALLNVVQNAIHAMPEGGILSLHARSRPGWLELAVRDTGPGIPHEARARIFEPFFTTKSTGSGLGLTIAQNIFREHGGEIQVDTKEGEGTTFYLRLPAAEDTEHVEDPGR